MALVVPTATFPCFKGRHDVSLPSSAALLLQDTPEKERGMEEERGERVKCS